MREMEKMDYQYENLGPEHFQEICQSLLVKEFPRTQCFPVAQPDGGRDATVFHLFHYAQEKEFIVFQVKFVRNPNAIADCHKWLTVGRPRKNKRVKKGKKSVI